METTKRALRSALACLVTLLRLVDDVNAALAPDKLVVTVARAQRLQGITDFHERETLKQITPGGRKPGQPA
jgi:hypothetical protein